MLTVPQNPVKENTERGIDSVLTMPFTGFDLTTLVRTVGETRAVESARSGSLVVTLFSPKGGVGRTTLAYNIAVALGQQSRVCLIDGSLQFSDLRGLLRVPAVAPSIVNLPTDRIRESDVSDVAWKDPSGIDILLASPRVEMAEMVTVRDLEKSLHGRDVEGGGSWFQLETEAERRSSRAGHACDFGPVRQHPLTPVRLGCILDTWEPRTARELWATSRHAGDRAHLEDRRQLDRLPQRLVLPHHAANRLEHVGRPLQESAGEVVLQSADPRERMVHPRARRGMRAARS